MRELFVYYRLAAAQADAVRNVVDGFQARLRDRHPGLVPRLLRRPVGPGETETWMEIYAMPDDGGVAADLEAAIADEATALDGLIIGPRHVEVFVPCAS